MVIDEVEQPQQQISICAACNQHIKDRYLFEVTNRKWHCVCLRCNHCKCPLTEKCWFKQNNLYCKDDYYKLFFSCNNCKQVIERDTFVRKTANMLYHLQCFACNQCGKILASGDHYIVHEDRLLCSNHYPNLLSLSNSKNSSTELITEQEGEIVVKTEQSNLNSSIDNQTGHFKTNNNSSHSQSFTSSLTSPNLIDNHNSFLLNRHQTPITSLPNSSIIPNNLSTSDHHTENLLPQSLSLIDYSHQPTSILNSNNNIKPGLNEFDSQAAADFYSTQSAVAAAAAASCYAVQSNPQLNSLPAPNTHLMNSIYEQDALRFYNSSNCLSQASSVPTPNSPLNEIENTNNSNNARKGRPRKRKQIGLSSSNNTGIDAISTALHEQNLNNLNNSNSSLNSQTLANSISNSNGHLQNSNSSNSSSSSTNGNHRNKRMRTSFKHSQLKSMKNYFNMNQNPDAVSLKALALETSLTKRILQVWFQNQRAKYRRSHSKCDGTFNQQNLSSSQTCLGSPDNSTRQFSTPSPTASIISNNSVSNNQSTAIQCETNHTINSSANLCSNGSSRDEQFDQYSPSNSSVFLRQTPPPSVKAPNSPSTNLQSTAATTQLHFGHHLTNSHSTNGLPNCHLNNFNSESIMSTFQDLY